MKLKIKVTNIQELFPARAANFIFGEKGGSIGASGRNDWVIQDNAESIPDGYGHIGYGPKGFTISPAQGANVYLNSATTSLRGRKVALLNDGDTMRIGDLDCTVQIYDEKHRSGEDFADQSVERLTHIEHDLSDHLVIDGQVEHAVERRIDERDDFAADPLSSFEAVKEEAYSMDPLRELDDVREKNKVSATRQIDEFDDFPSEAVYSVDHSDKQIAAINPKQIEGPRDNRGTQQRGYEFYYGDAPIEGEVDLDTMRLLARSLGVPFHDLTADEAPLILSDIGRSLNAAIEGLNKLFAAGTDSQRRFQFAQMNLHAIDDNPLRFSGSTEEALDAMFVNRSNVFLSPAAAVEESLKHIDQHQQATESAIEEALEAVMRALHPRALEKRFERYARGRVPTEGVERDAWKWRMFQSYVAEMSSHRQSGLRKLFWEVFVNAYQDRMRAFENAEFSVEDADSNQGAA